VYAQEVVSAKAGLVHYVEGKVFADQKPVEQMASTKLFSQATSLKDNSVLTTTEGRAEVLLAPGTTLRVGEDSRVKMISSKLTDTQLEILAGGVVLTIDELQKDASVTVRYKDATVTPKRAGVYKIHAEDPPVLMVYEGAAEVALNGATMMAKKGTAVQLDNIQLAKKFDTEKGDALLRWAGRRSGYLAMANVAAAKSLNDSGSTYGRSYTGIGTGMSGLWSWNPYFGMFTYVPYRGTLCNSFFGTCFYSPRTYARAYYGYYAPVYRSAYANAGGGGGTAVRSAPSYSYNPNLGYTTATGRSAGGYSGVSTGSGAPSAAASGVSAAASSGGGSRGGGASAGGGGGGRR
jgi:hypothetical protein